MGWPEAEHRDNLTTAYLHCFFYSTKPQNSVDGIAGGSAWCDMEAEVSRATGTSLGSTAGTLSRYRKLVLVLSASLHTHTQNF